MSVGEIVPGPSPELEVTPPTRISKEVFEKVIETANNLPSRTEAETATTLRVKLQMFPCGHLARTQSSGP